MSQQTFVSPPPSSRRPISLAVSLSIQLLALGLLIAVPLFIERSMPAVHLRSFVLGPVLPRTPERPTLQATNSANTSQSHIKVFRLTSPTVIPQRINPEQGSIPAVPDVITGSAGAAGAAGLLSDLSVLPNPTAPAMPKPAPAPVQTRSKPVPVGGNVAAANLLQRVDPVYPSLARSARIQGTVEFQAVITVEGRVRNLRLVAGHPLLIKAAETAIERWRYKPTLLNGKPVEVVTTITVRFALSN